MQIILIRHAEAVDESLALRDPHRHLTLHGRHQAKHLGDRLRWHDCAPTHVWTSPLVRAVQTAELVVGQFESEAVAALPIDVMPALAPDAEQGARTIAAAVAALPKYSVVYLVGHEPALSAIGAVILGDPQFAPLAKAQAARIMDGTLRWRFDWDGEHPHKP